MLVLLQKAVVLLALDTSVVAGTSRLQIRFKQGIHPFYGSCTFLRPGIRSIQCMQVHVSVMELILHCCQTSFMFMLLVFQGTDSLLLCRFYSCTASFKRTKVSVLAVSNKVFIALDVESMAGERSSWK